MSKLELRFNEMQKAIQVMREVSAWARERGYRVWPEEWLTPEEMVTDDARPENFCIGMLEGEVVCAFILQWKDGEYWPEEPEYGAAYLHKFCRQGYDGKGSRRGQRGMPKARDPLYSPGYGAG